MRRHGYSFWLLLAASAEAKRMWNASRPEAIASLLIFRSVSRTSLISFVLPMPGAGRTAGRAGQAGGRAGQVRQRGLDRLGREGRAD
eukprot:66230-Chlamydomonas_euryale.AAC.6